jgi:amino acid transporter
MQSRRLRHLPRGVSTLSLVFILFCTCGGPYTTETLIHSIGPGLGLTMLLLVPLIWSLPEVLIVGELASMLPEEGGYYRCSPRSVRLIGPRGKKPAGGK